MSTIYHYTNAQGLMGILDKSSKTINLWFTNYKYLNDPTEGTDIKRIYPLAIKEMLETRELTDAEYDVIKDLELKDEDIYAFKKNKDTVGHVGKEEEDSYICSFSENPDSLDMWRAYSKDHIGYAIGFFDFYLQSAANNQPFTSGNIGKFRWIKIVYDDDEKKKLIKDLIRCQKEKLKKSNVSIQQNLYVVVNHVLKELQFSFKHSCFRSEAEVRCVISVPHVSMDSNRKTIYDIKYRNVNGIIIPYIVFSFPRKALKEVRVSPGASTTAKDALEEYLKDYCPKRAKVHVEQSELPYRG